MSHERNHIDRDELTLYAMQLLGQGESAPILEHLKTCSECSAELAAIRGDLAMYALTAEQHAPMPTARQRLLHQVAREKKVAPSATPQQIATEDKTDRVETPGIAMPAGPEAAPQPVLEMARRLEPVERVDGDATATGKAGRMGRVLPWLGWPIAAGLAIAATSFYFERQQLRSSLMAESTRIATLTEEAARGEALIEALTDRGAMQVTLTETPGKEPVKPKPQGRATYIANKGMLVFLASNLAPLEPSKTYELWLIPAEAGVAPIPAGTFQPDARGDASVVMPTLPKGVAAKAFGVTIEDEGGSKVPTPPIVLSGA